MENQLTTIRNPLEERNNVTNDEEGDIIDHDDSKEFIMDGMISRKINRSKLLQNSTTAETLYYIRWYDYGPVDDKSEGIYHLPRSKIMTYNKKNRKKISLSHNIDDAIDGSRRTRNTFDLILRVS